MLTVEIRTEINSKKRIIKKEYLINHICTGSKHIVGTSTNLR